MPELTLRDGMVIVGSLLILAVIVDAWRRMRLQQRDRVRMKLATDTPSGDLIDDISQFRELPNGGARVVGRGDLPASIDEEPVGAAAEQGFAAPPRSGGSTASPRPASESSLREAERAAESHANRSATGQEPPTAAVRTTTREQNAPVTPRSAAESQQSENAAVTREVEAKPESKSEPESTSEEAPDEVAALVGMRADDGEPATLDWLEDLPAPDTRDRDEPAELTRQSDTEVLILHVMARDSTGFSGKDILEILLACDLRFGDMNFFHRHEEQAGRGPIQFSVANMLQPGFFDIDNMESMRTRGLVFFVTLPGPQDMAQAFDYMLETARTVARNLGGELLDESRSVLTQQAVEHSRQQIRELERRLRAQNA